MAPDKTKQLIEIKAACPEAFRVPRVRRRPACPACGVLGVPGSRNSVLVPVRHLEPAAKKPDS